MIQKFSRSQGTNETFKKASFFGSDLTSVLYVLALKNSFHKLQNASVLKSTRVRAD